MTLYDIGDIFKTSFIEGYESADINSKTVLICLGITAVLSIYIFFAYRLLTRKTFYSKTFNVSLAGLALITAAIIITIQSSIVVSLGMVGALSIVRFRTAIKEPMDLMFLFWSISTGIICGAGFAEYAVILAVILTIGILILNNIPVAKAPMILIINSSDIDSEDKIVKAVKKYSKVCNIKSRNMTADSMDLTIEVKTAEGGKLVRSILEEKGVESASLLQHDGEVTF